MTENEDLEIAKNVIVNMNVILNHATICALCQKHLADILGHATEKYKK